MVVLQTLTQLFHRLNDPDAIVRIDMDQSVHGAQCKLAVISSGVYAAGLVDAADWNTPDALIEAALQHFAACTTDRTKPGQSPRTLDTESPTQ